MSTSSPSQQLVVFAVHSEEYALPISHVQEIIRYTTPRTVASSNPVVCGVISLRGRIVPVLDLGLRLGLARAEGGDDAKIVIVEAGDDVAGLVVDDVTEVLTVDGDQIDDAPMGVHGGCLTGVAKIEDRLVVMLEPQTVIASLAEQAVAAEADAPRLQVVA